MAGTGAVDDPVVSIICSQGRFSLFASEVGSEPTIVPAQYLTIEVIGRDLTDSVLLDGRALPLIMNADRTRGLAMVDAFRSVGFHILQISHWEFLFASDDTKLRLDGILKLLDYLQGEGLAWGGQIYFTDGTAIRHAKIDYAWLRTSVPKILDLADSISARPLKRTRFVRKVGGDSGRPPFLLDTMSILRRESGSGIEEHESGAIEIGGRHYAPRIVVASKPQRSFDTIGNRRATRLLSSVLEMCDSVIVQDIRPPRAVRRDLEILRSAVANRLSLFPFAQLDRDLSRMPERPAAEEMVDDRYRAVFDLDEEISKHLGWQPGVTVANRMAYVNYADQIYQAFVAIVLARAFGAEQIFPSIVPRLSTALFRSERHEIYYDTVPPSPAFVNWRERSSRPSDQSPDMTIVDAAERKGILADAKYRVDPSGQLPSSALEEAQVYLQSFGVKSIALCYPGPSPRITRVTALGYTILEVAIGPFANLAEYAKSEVRPALEDAMDSLGANS